MKKQYLPSMVAALVLVGLLAGCDSNTTTTDAAIRRDGTDLQVAICRDMIVNQIRASYKGPERGEEWTSFWKVKGSYGFKSGDRISSDAALAGMEGGLWGSPPQKSGGRISISFWGDSQENTIDGIFRVPADGLSEDGWLRTNGSVTDAPCD